MLVSSQTNAHTNDDDDRQTIDRYRQNRSRKSQTPLAQIGSYPIATRPLKIRNRTGAVGWRISHPQCSRARVWMRSSSSLTICIYNTDTDTDRHCGPSDNPRDYAQTKTSIVFEPLTKNDLNRCGRLPSCSRSSLRENASQRRDAFGGAAEREQFACRRVVVVVAM